MAPTDSQWHAAGEDVHRSFWKVVVAAVLVEKDKELAAGKDRNGVDMVPIAESTRRKGRWRSHTGRGTADNPPLDPAQPLSRTRSLFTGRAHRDHAEFFWKLDVVSGAHWGRVLGYHRKGNPRKNLPVRDVIGLSPGSLARVQVKADKWWADWKRGQAMLRDVEQLRVNIPVQPLRPIPPRTPPSTIDLSRFTFGVGGEAGLRASIAAGSIKGYQLQGEKFLRDFTTHLPIGPPPPPPPAPPPKPPVAPRPPRPKPVPWVHPPRPIPGRPGRVPAAPKPPVVQVPAKKPPTVPPPPKPVTKPAATTLDLATFAARAKAAAKTVSGPKRFSDQKVLIVHAHEAYEKAHGPIALAKFKELLGMALQARHLDLSRADMIEAMDALEAANSVTFHPMSPGWEFHFIRTD